MRKMPTTKSAIPLVRLNLIQPFLDELSRREIDPTAALTEFDLSIDAVQNKELFVPAHVVYGVIETFAVIANDPYLGNSIGEALDISIWSPFVEASAKASNTAELLLMCAVNASKDASSSALNLETAGERTRFHVRRLADSNVMPAQVDSFWIGILVSLLKRAAASIWRPEDVLAKVCDPQTVPANYYDIHIAKGGIDGPSISFPSSWLFLPLARSVTINKSTQANSDTPATGFSDSVRQALLPHIGEQNLNVARAAEVCGLGVRVLQRKLQESGSTIIHEIATLRRERAMQELTQTQRSVAEIAGLVGFSDPTVFSRAFKKWTGMSPQKYRKQQS
jgi:AraC-like DNA-binding protein